MTNKQNRNSETKFEINFFRYLDTMKNVAKSNKNRFSFGYLDGVEFHQFAARYGIHKIPNFFVYDGTDSSYRETDVITGPHTAQAINAFLDDVLAGKSKSTKCFYIYDSFS